MSKPIWFKGDCDRILNELKKWYTHYHSTQHPVVREEVSMIDYTAEGGLRRIPTVRRVYIPLKEKDIDYMINIITELRPPDDPKYKRLAAMLENTRPIMKGSRLMAGGWYWTPMDFRRSDVQDLIEVMEEARTNKKVPSLEELIGKKKEGHGLWQ